MTTPGATTKRSGPTQPDRGQAAVLAIGVVAVLAVVLVAIGRFGRHLDDAARARTAADAAALAGVHGGRVRAQQLAADNGGHLVAFTAIGHDVLVTVRVDSATATARASDESEQLSSTVG